MEKLSYSHMVEYEDVDYTVEVNDDGYADFGIVWRAFGRNIFQKCVHTGASSEARPVVLPEIFSGSGLQHRPLQACLRCRKYPFKVWQSLRIQRATKFRCFFCCMVVLSLLSGADSSFVEVPKNTVVMKGESLEAIEMACKSDCQCNLLWYMKKNPDSEREELYDGYFLHSEAKSYCAVITDEPGKCYLNLTNTKEVAQTYICLEPSSLHEVSADLIWLGDTICKDSSTEDLVNLTCSIEFRGNWAPMMEWKEHSSQDEKILSVGVNTSTVHNQLVKSTLVMDVQDGSRNYTCTIKFDINGKPRHTTATNIPAYTFSVIVRQQDKPERNEISYTPMLGLLALCIVPLGVFLLLFIVWKKGCSMKSTQPRQTIKEQEGGDDLL